MSDITGQVFGSMRAIDLNEHETEIRTIRYGHKRYAWNCECIICGHKTVKLESDLKALKRTGKNGCKECQRVDLTGQKIGRLTILGLAEQQVWGKQLWLCKCDCGKEVVHETGQLTAKNPVQSCGCLQKEVASEIGKRTVHLIPKYEGPWNGDSKNPKTARLFNCWTSMKRRCNSPKAFYYQRYGGRGITYTEEWEDWFAFKKWALTHGYSDNLTLDRIDIDGDYTPDNCRWVTMTEQMNNMSRNKILTYHGEDDTLANWCRRLNLDYFRTKARLNTCGYSVEDAFERGKYEYRTT